MTRRGFTTRELAVVIGVLVILLGCLGVWGPLEFVLRLALGWISFLWTVTPRMRLDLEATLLFGTCLLAMTVGSHWFLSWLYRAALPEQATDVEVRPRHWRRRWTVSVVAILVMMFVAGTAMVGIAHQIVWLATAPASLFEGGGLREAAQRSQSNNNLKQLVIGLHNYHDVYSRFPAGMSVDASGRARHGWLTHSLPFSMISAETIDFEKPWDDRHNRPTFEIPVKQFMIPRAELPQHDADGLALAHYAGNVRVLGGTKAWSTAEMTDGTSQTILLGEAAGNFKPWGHPHNWRDPALGINTSPDGFGGPWTSGGANFAMADGSVRFIRAEIDPAVLRGLATPAGGETIPDDF